MNKNKISIIIPCYNGAQFLKGTIESVLKQTFKNFTLFLVDNGSTDNSYAIMKMYRSKDKRIKLIRFKKKTSRAKSINNVVKKNCKSKLISVLDADDLFFKNKIYKQIIYLKKNPKIKVLGTLANYINIENNLTAGISSTDLVNHNSCFKLIKNNKSIGIVTPSVVFYRDIFLKVGGFKEDYWPADDTDLWSRIAQKGYIVFTLPEILLSYRIHASSITTSNFFYSRLKAMWVKENIFLRNINHREVSFLKFKKKIMKKNIFYKFKELVNDISDLYFRNSVIFLINKNYVFFLLNMIISSLFSPVRFFKKVLNRVKI